MVHIHHYLDGYKKVHDKVVSDVRSLASDLSLQGSLKEDENTLSYYSSQHPVVFPLFFCFIKLISGHQSLMKCISDKGTVFMVTTKATEPTALPDSLKDIRDSKRSFTSLVIDNVQ